MRGFEQRDRIEGRQCEETGRRRLSASQGERPTKDVTLQLPEGTNPVNTLSQTSFQNCKIMFVVCGTVL